MNSYSNYKLKSYTFIILLNLLFSLFAGFQFSYWEYDLNPLLLPILISSAIALLITIIIIFFINSIINSIEEDLSFFIENEITQEIQTDIYRKFNRINVILYIYSILLWLLSIPIINLILNIPIFNGLFFMRWSFFISIGIVTASIQVIVINYFLENLKKRVKIYKLNNFSKSGMIRRRILLLVFIPVMCITFGLNYNYDNMLNASGEIKQIIKTENNDIANNANEIQDRMNSTMRNSFILNTILGIILIGISSLFLFISNTEVRQRLKSIFNKILAFNKEDKNLIDRLEITSNDEFGLLSEKLNDYMETQRQNVDYIKSMHHIILDGVSNLQVSVDSLKTIGIDLESFKDNSKNTKEQTKNVLDKTKSYILDLSNSITKINDNLQSQMDKMIYSTEIISNTLSGLTSITDDSKRAMESVADMLNQSEKGSKAMTEHIKVMSELSEYSEGVVEIVEAINSIAKKTNLLAMNASIEAAHAGDAGKGFAVVAEEIRRLAETSSHNIKEITERMRSVAEKIDHSSQTVMVAGKSFKSIFNGIKQINTTFKNISSKIQKQEDNTKEISKSINELTNSTHTIKSLSDKQNEQSKEIVSLNNNLDKIRENLNKENNMIEDNVSAMKNQMEEIKIVAEENKKIISDLSEYSGKYITENPNKTKSIEGKSEEKKDITPSDY